MSYTQKCPKCKNDFPWAYGGAFFSWAEYDRWLEEQCPYCNPDIEEFKDILTRLREERVDAEGDVALLVVDPRPDKEETGYAIQLKGSDALHSLARAPERRTKSTILAAEALGWPVHINTLGLSRRVVEPLIALSPSFQRKLRDLMLEGMRGEGLGSNEEGDEEVYWDYLLEQGFDIMGTLLLYWETSGQTLTAYAINTGRVLAKGSAEEIAGLEVPRWPPRVPS